MIFMVKDIFSLIPLILWQCTWVTFLGILVHLLVQKFLIYVLITYSAVKSSGYWSRQANVMPHFLQRMRQTMQTSFTKGICLQIIYNVISTLDQIQVINCGI